MRQMNLEDVESYMMERAKDREEPCHGDLLVAWLQIIFAELRAREQSRKVFYTTEEVKEIKKKEIIKNRQAALRDSELVRQHAEEEAKTHVK